MRNCLFIFLLFAGILNTYAKKSELVEIKKFGKNSGNLKMFVYDPFTEKSKIKRALVVVMHGCNQNAKGVAELTGWNKIAKGYKFYVVYPQQKKTNNPSSCFNWFEEKDIMRESGECTSVHDMISYMKMNFEIDTTQIYITGLSAGAAMSVAMLAIYPQVFKSGAIFSGGPYKSATNAIDAVSSMRGKTKHSLVEWKKLITDENPNYSNTYPKIIIYHGKKDGIVNYQNALNLVKQWTALHNTDTICDATINPFNKIDELTLQKFNDTNNQTIVKLYSVAEMGHKLLIHPGPGEQDGGKNGLFSHDINFHSTFQTALDFGLIIK